MSSTQKLHLLLRRQDSLKAMANGEGDTKKVIMDRPASELRMPTYSWDELKEVMGSPSDMGFHCVSTCLFLSSLPRPWGASV